jgi:hypothetical protein
LGALNSCSPRNKRLCEIRVEFPLWKYLIIATLIVITKMIYEKEKSLLTTNKKMHKIRLSAVREEQVR